MVKNCDWARTVDRTKPDGPSCRVGAADATARMKGGPQHSIRQITTLLHAGATESSQMTVECRWDRSLSERVRRADNVTPLLWPRMLACHGLSAGD